MADISDKFTAALPDLRISSDAATLKGFGEDERGARGATPIALVKPESGKQLRELVLFCGKNGLRLRTMSSKGAHFTKDARCAPETVMLDMSKFDAVIQTNRRNRVLMFEAGVTFDTLTASAGETGLRPLLPLCPRPGKSALTSYLDREPTIYPRFQWDLSDPMLCVEMITGAGQLFRTGSAAGPGDLTDQWKAGDAQKFPMGPGALDAMRLFQGARGGLGVVT
ncbi:MAG: FAD-binding oxidoreductase, partial [Desulfobacterales bacterium]|nr:FAD-binding oxidoreductase [Desulfobacterales bacterium]